MIEDLKMSLLHIKCLTSLLEENEYRQYLYSHLIPIQIELQRQLTNLRHSAKLNK
jgi:hypothetical protein